MLQVRCGGVGGVGTVGVAVLFVSGSRGCRW